MPRLTPRDLAMSIGFVVLTAAVTALALLGLQRWAIAGIAVLIGLSMLISYAQFVVRRDTYQRIRREGRSTRDAVRQVERLVATANDRGKAAHADVTKLRDELRKVAAASKEMTGALQSTDRVSAKVSDALRADLATLREQLTQSAGAQQALSAKVAEATLESSGSRAELRGVRVAQQLFSQTVVGVKAEVSEIASLLGRSATKDDVADLGRLEEIAS
ncbi:hypothetical protein, partial [uncultured Microbacterium sp.]|uniref:hypothetical protein n=1 Tax=uncultured Microbacterium sp. TaxID=191216 RepID=UPI0026336D6C